jgi:hypothetical protein
MAKNAARAFLVALSFTGSVSAQTPSTPPADPRAVAPAAAASTVHQGTSPSKPHAGPSGNQFFSPVMGIDIEGQGLSLPKGVAEDPLVKPAAEPPASPPAATPK